MHEIALLKPAVAAGSEKKEPHNIEKK